MDWVLRFPSSVYDGIEPPSNGITVALHGALGAQPVVSSTKYPCPRVLATSTATFATAHHTRGHSLRGCINNAVPMSPRYLHKFSHYHIPAPAEGPCHSHPRPMPPPRGDSLPRRTSFSRSRDAGFAPYFILDFDRGERFPANGGLKLYIQFLVAMVCHLYICTVAHR